MAFAVWQVLRSVTLWTGEPAPRRAGMFDPAYMAEWERRLLTATLDPGARFPLAVIVAELAGPDPQAGSLSWACVCVADWALGRGATRTALSFAEAAAHAAPEHPRYAWLVGRLMRTHGDPRGGERWLRRALRLAIAQRDWETQARALTGLGNLCVETGRYPEAKDLHTRALRVSRRWRLREQEGMALHDLFVVATEEGNRSEAELHARGALDAYGRSTARVCRLAHDVAYWWMDDGYYQRALDVFLAVLGHFSQLDDRMRVMGNIGRAAGGCGDREAFDSAWRALDTLDPLLVTRSTAATALLELAYGAVSLGDWPLAARIAQRAADAARERSEAPVLNRASELLAAVQHPNPALELAAARLGSGAATADRLAAALVASLREPADEAAALAALN
jgi:tetratricopeptide (TPR) repeat protein